MKPKEKAKELFNKYSFIKIIFGYDLPSDKAKECAIICVDEILKELGCAYNGAPITTNDHKEYWIAVKSEIENL